MTIAIPCTQCGQRLKVRPELAGHKGKCPACGSVIDIPKDLDTLPPGASKVDREQYDFLAPAQQPDELGRLANYRVLKVLGSGGMGVVFEAEDLSLKRRVALKVLRPALAASESSRQRFLQEAQMAAALVHDHIVTIYQIGEDRGLPFLAMQLLQGESLEDRLYRVKRFPLSEVLRIGRETAEGLQAAHERGLIHRDIKPANIWLEAGRDRVKLLDFGLARAAGGDTRLTQLGAVVGTPAYMSPEQANARPLDARSDLFSLGCVLYRLCTRALPFTGNDLLATLSALATHTPTSIYKLNPEAPASLSDLVDQLLSRKPEGRPSSARKVADALAAIEEELKAGPAEQPFVAVEEEELLDEVEVISEETPRSENRPSARPSRSTSRSAVRSERKEPPVEEERRRPRPQPREKESSASAIVVPVIVIGSLLVLGLIIGIVYLRWKREGALMVTVDQADAEVYVDGGLWAYSSGREGDAIRVPLARGEHDLKVVKEGFDTHHQRITILPGEEQGIFVRLGRPAVVQLPVDPLPPDPPKPPPEIKLPLTIATTNLPPASALAFNGPRTRLISAHGPTLKTWDLASGKELANFTSPDGAMIDRVVCPAEGETVAVGSGKELKLLEIDTLKPRRTVALYGRVTALASSTDGRLLAAATGKSIALLDAASGNDRGTLEGHEAAVQSLVFVPQENQLLSLGQDGGLRQWDVASAKETKKYPRPKTSGVTHTTLSPDGKLAAVLSGSVATVWEVGGGRETEIIAGAATALEGVDFLPEGHQFLTATRQGVFTCWETAMFHRKADLQPGPEGQSIGKLAFSHDGKTFALSAPNLLKVGEIRELLRSTSEKQPLPAFRLISVTRTETRRFELLPVFPATQGVTCVTFLPDGKHGVMASTDACLRIWDLESGQGIGTFVWKERKSSGPVSSLCFIGGGRQLFSGSPDGLRLWDLAFGREVPRFEGEFTQAERLPTTATAFSADGRRGITRAGGKLWVWETATAKMLKSFATPQPNDAGLSLSPDGQQALDGATLWDLDKYDVIRKLEGLTETVKQTAFSPNGKRALTLCEGTVRLWNLENGQEVRKLSELKAASVAFSPDGRRALTGATDGTVRVWDLENGNELHRFFGHSGEVASVAFSPDGQRLLTGSADKSMRLWQLSAPAPP